MKLYIAGPYAARDRLRAYAAELSRIGYTVTSRWLEETHPITSGTVDAAVELTDEQVSQHALDDLVDVGQSGLLVVFTGNVLGVQAGSGGRHVETGYFLGQRPQRRRSSIIVVGEPENIFHRMRDITVVPTWHEAVVELGARLVEHERSQPQELLR